MVYWPFRKRFLDKIELLNPKATFYAMLYVATLCFCWIGSILMISLLEIVYTDVTTITLTTYILATCVVGLFASVFSLIVINRFFRLYELNMKGAFKVDFQQDFVKLDQGLEDYNPDNDEELEEIRMYQEITKGKKLDNSVNKGTMNSTRKLLLGDTLKKGLRSETEKTVV